MKAMWWLIAAMLFQPVTAGSQSGPKPFQAPDGPYFGQKPPGLTPEVFAPGVISTDAFEFAGTFSPDGKEYLFTRRPTYEGSDNRIYVTRRAGGHWTEPAVAPFAKNVFEFIPVFSPDGKTLLFYSERPKPSAGDLDGSIWTAHKSEQGWSDAQYFLNPANRKFCMMISATRQGTIYFSGVYGNRRGVFRSDHRAGRYGEMEYLPEEVNSIRPVHPFIAPDESYLIMDAQVRGMGKPELFISFRNPDGSWTRAANMGPAINATGTEFAGSVSPDGKYLFFHRRANGNGDIYWVSAAVIDGLRPKDSR